VKFEVQSVGRSGSRAIVENGYPYTDGADLDDLGLKARRVTVKAIVWGDDYETDLAQLMSALESSGAGELIHPVHGPMMALAESWSDDHDVDLVDGAMVSIVFVEDKTRKVIFTASSSVTKMEAVSVAADEARAAADDTLVRRVEDAQDAGLLRLSVLKDSFNQAKAQLTALTDTSALRAVLSDLDPVLYPRAYAADLLAVVDRALQGLPFGGRNILFDAIGGNNVVSGSGLQDFNTVVSVVSPSAMALAPNVVAPDATMTADVAIVQAHIRAHAACAIADCAIIVLAGEMDTPLLDRSDIETLTNVTRTGLQVAIDSARSALDAEGRGQVSAALRDVAYAVQQAAQAVINQRPPVVRRHCPISGPVRLVAHQLYGDASRGDEISRLNSLGRSVYLQRGEDLHVYAI